MTDLTAEMKLYAELGYLVMASNRPMAIGPFEDNDWNEEEMAEFRWKVIGNSNREELAEQNRRLGVGTKIHPSFRWFYRIEAMD